MKLQQLISALFLTTAIPFAMAATAENSNTTPSDTTSSEITTPDTTASDTSSASTASPTDEASASNCEAIKSDIEQRILQNGVPADHFTLTVVANDQLHQATGSEVGHCGHGQYKIYYSKQPAQ